MSSKLTVFTALALMIAGLAAGAQHHPANYLLSGSSIQILQGSGTFSTIYNNTGTAHGVTTDVDNYNLIYPVSDLFRVDPKTGVVSTVFMSGLGGSNHVVVDHNGDYVITGIGLGSSNYSVFRISNNTLTTVAAMKSTSGTFSFTGGLIRDIDTGNFALQVYGGSGGPHPIISVAPDGTYTTLVANISTLGGPRYEFTQDIRSGDFFVGVNDTTAGYLVRAPKSGAPSVVAKTQDRFAFNTVVADRASAAAPRLVHPYRSNLYYTDLAGFTVTSVAVNGTSVSPRDVDIWQGRNIQSVRTAPGKFTLRYSFPAYPGLAYVAGLSLAGVRPGVTLSDGRGILLNPDVFTILTVNNLVPGIFTQGPATLDKTGEAQGALDVSALPPLGLPAHIVVLVLDTKAPMGIAAVSDPYVLPL